MDLDAISFVSLLAIAVWLVVGAIRAGRRDAERERLLERLQGRGAA